MYKNKKIITTICARGGSKGIKNKNIKPLLGMPLLAHTIVQAQRLGWIDKIIVSTDSEAIKAVAEKYNVPVPFLRPDTLATDTAPKLPAVCHAVKTAEELWGEHYDIVLDLDPTNPLREDEDIIGVLEALIDSTAARAAFSVTPAYKNPYMNMIEPDENGYAHVVKTPPHPILRRQDAPPVFEVVASVYAIVRSELEKIKFFPTEKNAYYVMPEERALDIDSEFDFEITELLLERKKKQ